MKKTIIFTKKAPAPIGPYSQAVLVDNTLYVSGQIGVDAYADAWINESIEKETEQVMKNISYILEEADMDFSNVIKCSIFVDNMGNFAKINQIYGSFFSDNPPARETVEVSCLPKNVHVEISCIAVK